MAERKGSLIAKSVSKHAGRAKEKVMCCLLLNLILFSVRIKIIPEIKLYRKYQ